MKTDLKLAAGTEPLWDYEKRYAYTPEVIDDVAGLIATEVRVYGTDGGEYLSTAVSVEMINQPCTPHEVHGSKRHLDGELEFVAVLDSLKSLPDGYLATYCVQTK